MKVKDVMNEHTVKYCTPETKLRKAATVMRTGKCGALPVVDNEKKVLGIITDRDICLSLANKESKPIGKATVGKFMQAKVFTVNMNDDISKAYKQMRTNKIGRLPVVDADGKLKGMISMHNLISKSFSNGNEYLGDISSHGENLLKTMQAITNHYSGNGAANAKKNQAAKQTKAEKDYEEAL